MSDLSNTQFFQVEPGPQISAKDILEIVYKALKEKGYNPVNQIVGYIMSGDPTYITSYNGARSLIMKVERDELVEELLKAYIEENKLRRTLARIEELVREYEVDTIVLGFPKHMNNDVGERAKKSLEFKEMLVRRTGLDVVMWDERLTTVEAERTLIESQVRRENRKQYIDKIAAVFILQGYLDSIYLKKKAEEEN